MTEPYQMIGYIHEGPAAVQRTLETGKTCRKIANAGVDINLVYLATNTRLVIGADDLDKASAAIRA